MNFTVSSCLFSGHGFGFNTNILETNVINLGAARSPKIKRDRFWAGAH
jgi:hypothetical protein